MYSYFEPSTDNASEDTNLDDDGFTNLTEYQNETNPVDEDNRSPQQLLTDAALWRFIARSCQLTMEGQTSITCGA